MIFKRILTSTLLMPILSFAMHQCDCNPKAIEKDKDKAEMCKQLAELTTKLNKMSTELDQRKKAEEVAKQEAIKQKELQERARKENTGWAKEYLSKRYGEICSVNLPADQEDCRVIKEEFLTCILQSRSWLDDSRREVAQAVHNIGNRYDLPERIMIHEVNLIDRARKRFWRAKYMPRCSWWFVRENSLSEQLCAEKKRKAREDVLDKFFRDKKPE